MEREGGRGSPAVFRWCERIRPIMPPDSMRKRTISGGSSTAETELSWKKNYFGPAAAGSLRAGGGWGRGRGLTLRMWLITAE